MIRFLALSIASALLLAFSWPTFGFPLLIFIAFVPLLYIENKLSQQNYTQHKSLKLFGYVYLSFFIWQAISLNWLFNALETNAKGELTNSWSAYLVPIFANALLMSITFMLYHWVKNKAGNYYGMFFLPCVWIAFENLHLNWELAFPWFNLGNVFAQYPQWIQWYEFTGTFGGTLWVWIVNLIIFYQVYGFYNQQNKLFLKNIIYWALPLIAAPILISYILFYTYQEDGEEITALVIQPELNPYTEKYNTNPLQIVSDLNRLTNQHITPEVDFVVAPETAFPGPGPGLLIDKLNQDYLIHQIKTNLNQYPNTSFVSGVELMQKYPNKALASKTAFKYGNTLWYVDVYNSAIQFNQKDSIQYYHKSKLLVGIEQFPYAHILKPLLGDVLLNFGGTVRSHAMQEQRSVFTNSYNAATIAPIICYESVFGEFVTDYIKKGANVLFVMSNDSWWDNSDGHKELLLFGNIRAIENRRSIVRAANSGVSGFINQKGVIESKLDYGIESALVGKVKLNNKITFYTQYGDYIARITLLFVGIILAYTVSIDLVQIIKPKKKQSN